MSKLALEVRSFHQYPPIPRSTDELMVLHPIRVEQCACGEWLRQYPGDHPMLTVHLHNQTIAHKAWRARLGS